MLYVCKDCKQLLRTEAFLWRNRYNKDGQKSRNSICRDCKNKQTQKYKPPQSKSDKIKEWIDSIKINIGCLICQECSHPQLLDLHHINPEIKEDQIPNMIQRGYSINAIYTELKKCAVLCANCHRKLHADRFSLLPNIMETYYENLPMLEM